MADMRVDSDDFFIEQCRRLVEKKLGWGESGQWTHHDFETLAEKILAATGVNLSVATLKRIWGKVKYSSRPTSTTLDILAQFVGYQNWREFQVSEITTQPIKSQHLATPLRKPPWRLSVISVIIGAASFLILGFVFLSAIKNKKRNPPDANAFSFTSKKVVSEGVPNSVIFEYDAGAAEEGDTIYIQQSWDKNLRQQVSRKENNATSIYYYPGFFQAKLVVGGRVVKEHGLYIRTDGWLPLIEQKDVPVYFAEEDVLMNGVMTLPLGSIVSSGVLLQPVTPWVSFHNATEFGDLRSDNFIFQTSLKNEYNEGSNVCQLTEIHIRFEGGLYLIPLSIKGCVSKLELYDVKGKKSDPTFLGCDFSDWVNVKLEVKARKGELFINGTKAFDLDYDIPPSKIVALQYRFQGTGSVDHVTLSNIDGEVIYREQF